MNIMKYNHLYDCRLYSPSLLGRVVRKKTTETLNRDRTLKSRRGLDVDEIGGSGNRDRKSVV